MIKANDNVVPRCALRALYVNKLYILTEIKKRETFDALIERIWGTSIIPLNGSTAKDVEKWEEYYDEDELPRLNPEIEDEVDTNGKLIYQQPAYDKIINAKVLLQQKDNVRTAKVIRRVIGPDGITVGQYYDNPGLNSIIYDLEIPDGNVK